MAQNIKTNLVIATPKMPIYLPPIFVHLEANEIPHGKYIETERPIRTADTHTASIYNVPAPTVHNIAEIIRYNVGDINFEIKIAPKRDTATAPQ